MRQTFFSLSLVITLASSHVFADTDTVNALTAAGVTLSRGHTETLNAAEGKEMIAVLEEIIAAAPENAVEIVSAAAKVHPENAAAYAAVAAVKVPDQATAITNAASLAAPKYATDINNAVREALAAARLSPWSGSANTSFSSIPSSGGGSPASPN